MCVCVVCVFVFVCICVCVCPRVVCVYVYVSCYVDRERGAETEEPPYPAHVDEVLNGIMCNVDRRQVAGCSATDAMQPR